MIVAALVLAARLTDAQAIESVRVSMGSPKNFVAQIYDRHSDRAARTVVCGIQGEDRRGQLCVAQLTPAGRARVKQRMDVELAPHEIQVRDLIGDDRDEVVVELLTWTRNPAHCVYRMRNERLHEIAVVGTYWGFEPFDLDRDGVPELLDTGCCDNGRVCAVGIGITYLRYEHGRYRATGPRYVDAFTVLLEGQPLLTEEILSLPPLPERGKRYVLHVYNGDGVSAPRATKASIRDGGKVLLTIDGDTDRIDVPVSFDRECHTLQIAAEGPPGALIHFLLQDVAKKRK